MKIGNLVFTRKHGQSVCIGDDITVTVLFAPNGAVKLAVMAPECVAIDRAEVRQRQIGGQAHG